MNKELYKKIVYEKYENQLKNNNDEFFYSKIHNKKNYYKENILRIAASILISITVTAGLVYAGIVTHNYYQEKTKINFESEYMNILEYNNGIYYKKIKTFDEYTKNKDIVIDSMNVTEEDFKNNFILIIMTENGSLAGLNVNDIRNEKDKLVIELYQNKSDVNENTLIVKVPCEQDRNNIEFKIISEQPTNENYTNLKDLNKEYSKNEALEDNCFVLEDGKIISNDSDQLYKFVVNSKNDENGFIRIVDITNNKSKIIDIEYKESMYYVCIDNTRIDEYSDLKYITGTELMLSRKVNTDTTAVYLIDEYLNQYPICVFN